MAVGDSSLVLGRVARFARGVAGAVGLACLTLGPNAASAATSAQGGQAGGQVSYGTGGVSSSGSSARRGSGGFAWPDRVIAGNAVAGIMPLQIGFLGYMPRARIGFQYDRQIQLGHWVHIGVAGLFDRGSWQSFKHGACGFGASPPAGSCEHGTVAGFDLYAGYNYKFYLKDRPYLIPYVRGSIGGGWWKYPKLGSSRLQSLDWSGSGSLRLGGGLRLFLLDYLALGADLALVIGFTRSRDAPLAGEASMVTQFLLGMEILPLIVEYRF